MNCLYETVAVAYLQVWARFAPPPNGDDLLCDAEENLEECRSGLVAREKELAHQCEALGRMALGKRRAGDAPAARFAMQARRGVFHWCPLGFF